MSVFVNIIAQADLPLAIAAGVPETSLGEVQFDATVTEITFVPEGPMTGATATARTMTVYNRGQATPPTGTTVLATLAFVTGVDLVANDEKTLTLTATVADRNVTKDDVLECVETVASTGTARPEGKMTVKGTRR